MHFVSATKYRLSLTRHHTDGWQSSPKEFRASFEISIGNPNCTGEPFRCIVEWASELFGSFEVSLGDTLTAYNYHVIGGPGFGRLPFDQAVLKSREAGDVWLAQNEPTLSGILGINSYRILRWDDWKKHSEFADSLRSIESYRHQDAAFQRTISEDIDAFLRRRQLSADDISDADAQFLSTFIIEEIAVYLIQAGERPTVSIYPGSPLKTEATMGRFVGLPNALRSRQFAYVEVKPPKK